jgi:hypothetical protein
VTGLLFFAGSTVSFTNKTDRHEITEILLKVALNTITLVFGFFTIYVMSFLTSQWLLSYQGQIYNYGYLASFSTILQEVRNDITYIVKKPNTAELVKSDT